MRFEEVYDRWTEARLTQQEAAALLGVCERQLRRQCRRYESDGIDGLIDLRLGQRSTRRAPVDEVMQLVEQYRGRYVGWTVKHFYSKYREQKGRRSYNLVRLTLQREGVVSKAKRRGAHRRKRERKPLIGMMLHQDGSRYQWLRGQQHDLIVTLDDATGAIYSALLVDEEGTMSSFAGVAAVIAGHGLFNSLYTDRGSHYWHTTRAGGKVDRVDLTQFGRAMAQLGIEMIPAYSPEARGRSERAFGTLQDRLPKELLDAAITEVAAANRFLQRRFIPADNREFAVPAAESGRPSCPGSGPTGTTSYACRKSALSAPITASSTTTSSCKSRPTVTVATTSKRPYGSTNIQTDSWRSSMARVAWPTTLPTARSSNQNCDTPLNSPFKQHQQRTFSVLLKPDILTCY